MILVSLCAPPYHPFTGIKNGTFVPFVYAHKHTHAVQGSGWFRVYYPGLERVSRCKKNRDDAQPVRGEN
jgi:hypothetical protein